MQTLNVLTGADIIKIIAVSLLFLTAVHYIRKG